MPQLVLDFAHSNGQIQLERTAFKLNSGAEYVAVRGKTPGAYNCTGSFQWTPAVKAVCVLFLQAIVRDFAGEDKTSPTISGKRGSLASSLDYAIDKEPQWLCDMFGLDDSGKSTLRRLIFRSNPGGKRPSPVSVSLNESALPPENIRVLVDSMPVHDHAFLTNIIATLLDESGVSALGEKSASFESSMQHAQVKRADIWKRRMMIPPKGEPDDCIPKIASVSYDDIDDIYEYEEQEFPGHHATKERLREWRDHDPSNFICIKSKDEPVMGYYILFLLKPESMKRFLSGELLEDDVRSSDMLEPTPENFKNQRDAHICVFASKRHASLFTADLLWHLLGRIIYLAEFGNLSKIYAEATTVEGERILKRFKFQPAQGISHNGDPLFETTITPEKLAQWHHWYAERSFAQTTTPAPVFV